MTDSQGDDGETLEAPPEEEEEESRAPGWLLGLAGIALLLVPTLIGIAMIRSRGGGDGGGTTSGMGDGGTPAVVDEAVHDLMSIVDADGITVEVNGDGTATVRVTTVIPVACAVSYGPTEDLGSIATDTDMAGGGHTDHHPLLVNLEPDTDYYYTISAIAADGSLYTIPQRVFTNGGAGSAAPGPNIASSATILDVSSEFSDQFAAELAIDGDRSTEWSSNGDGDNAYIVLGFAEPADIVGVGFRTREMSDGTSITNTFTVTVDDGEPLGPFDAGPGLAVAEFTATGSKVRIDVATSTGGNTGAVEIEVYGSGGGQAAAATTTTTLAAAGDAPLGPNVAEGAHVVAVSSEFSDQYAAANAVDGDLSTEWSSAGDGNDAFIEIDLGEEFEIVGVGFRTREMSDGTAITNTFTVLVNGTSIGTFPAGPGLAVSPLDAVGDTVRFEVDTSTGGNTGAVEIEVYGYPTM